MMSPKAKRKLEATDASSGRKRVRTLRDTPVKRDLLDRCYDKVTTLREYILLKLPPRSRLRRKKVASVGKRDDVGELERSLSRLLDTSLVCFADQQNVEDDYTRKRQLIEFTQKGDESHVSLSDGISGLWISSYGYSFIENQTLEDGPNTSYATASKDQAAQTIKGRPISRIYSATTLILM
ncbi:hypothetical protein ACHAPD_001743 [Fusarium lateritium]